MAWDDEAAGRPAAEPQRRWQIALGLIWLLDAGLQFQPFMFSRAFVTGVIEPAGAGSPGFVARPIALAGQLLLHDPVAFNAAFASVQLVIGLGMLWRPSVRAALAGSIAWALSIWWLGEGLGGLLSGSASPVTGAPGAAVLYALIALLAWPSHAHAAHGTSRGRAVAGRRWARLAWLALWGSGAYLLLQTPSRAPSTLRGVIAGAATGEPGWIAALDRRAAAAIGAHSTTVSIAAAVIFAVIALGIGIPALTRPVLVLAVVVAAASWALGQGFGQILTGHATDPNTGPLLSLLAAVYWPRPRFGAAAGAAAAAGKHRAGRPQPDGDPVAGAAISADQWSSQWSSQ